MSGRPLTIRNTGAGEGLNLLRRRAPDNATSGIFLYFSVATLLPVAFVGCGPTPSSVEKHHHVHRRLTFAEAVGEIQFRSVRFTSDAVSTDAALLEWKKQKLLEIVRQLPLLAADSDMKKSEWDRVNVSSKELLQILQSQDVVSNDGILLERTRFLELIASIQQATSSNQTPEF